MVRIGDPDNPEHDRATWIYVANTYTQPGGYQGVLTRAYSFSPEWYCVHRHKTRTGALACARSAWADWTPRR